MHDTKLKAIVFAVGDLLGMVVAWIHLEHGFFTTLWMTIVFGVIGGFCSMAGRDIWTYIKNKYIKS